mgnify:CR=1 FL=1
MDVTISGRHMQVTEPMERHIRSRIAKLTRYDDQIISVTVTLENDSNREQVEVIAKCHRNVLVTNAEGHDLYDSIDEAFSKLERRVSRLHDKLVNQKARQGQQAAEENRRPE